MVQFHCRPSLFTNFAKMTKNLEKLEHWLGSFFFFGGGGVLFSFWLVGRGSMEALRKIYNYGYFSQALAF